MVTRTADDADVICVVPLPMAHLEKRDRLQERCTSPLPPLSSLPLRRYAESSNRSCVNGTDGSSPLIRCDAIANYPEENPSVRQRRRSTSRELISHEAPRPLTSTLLARRTLRRACDR